MNKLYPIEICKSTGEVTAILRSRVDVLNFRKDFSGIDRLIVEFEDENSPEGSYLEYIRPLDLAVKADPFIQMYIVLEIIERFPGVKNNVFISLKRRGGRSRKYDASVLKELTDDYTSWICTTTNKSVRGFLDQLKPVPKSITQTASVYLKSGAIIGKSSAKKHLDKISSEFPLYYKKNAQN